MMSKLLRAIGAALGGVFVTALMRAAIPDATSVGAKWSQRSQAAQTDFTEGVQNTDKDPTALAIAAIPRMKARINEAIDNGKVANGLRRAGKQGWQSATLAKANNYSTGVQAAESKVVAAFGPLLAYEAQVQSRINSMPNITLADRIARSAEWIRQMAAYPGA